MRILLFLFCSVSIFAMDENETDPSVTALSETPILVHNPGRKERPQSTDAKILAAFALKHEGERLLNQALKQNRQDLIFGLIEDVAIQNSHYQTVLASALSLQEKKTFFALLANKTKPDNECISLLIEYINKEEKLLSILPQAKERLESYKTWKSELLEICSQNKIEAPSDCILS